MQVKELVLKNFKSFDYASIPFKPGFQVIVGPNGSGKSNIIDALLFGFGSTSLKRLRVDKTANLVNQSAKERTARVRVVFNHEGKDLDIIREIDETGKSACSLDGKRKALNEITSFLAEVGITADGYYTVQQGDVTRIINMNPEERRKIIEDISGISLFDERKKEAQDNLDKVNKRLDKVSIALNERKPYVEQLSAERENALKFKELDSLEQLYNYNLYNQQITEFNNELILEDGKINKLLSEIEDNNKEKKNILLEISDLENKLETINNDLISHSEKVQSTFGKELSERKANKEIILNNLNLRQENIDYLTKENNRLALEITELIKEENTLTIIIKEQEEKLRNKNKIKSELKEKIQKSSKEFEEIRTVQEELYSRLSTINKEITKQQDEYFSNKNKISAYEFQKESLEKQTKERDENQKQLSIRKKELESSISTLRKELSDIEKEIQNSNKLLETKTKEKEELQLQFNQKTIEVSGLRKDLSFSSSALEKRDKLKEKLKAHKTFLGFLDDFVSLNKHQKSVYSNYIILKEKSEISKIIKEFENINFNFVVLSSIGVSEKELSNHFQEHFNTKHKVEEIDGFYFDGFCYKRILVKDTKELEEKINHIDKELEKIKAHLQEATTKISETSQELTQKTKEQTQLQVRLNTSIQTLDDIIENLEGITSKSSGESGATIKTITQNLGQLSSQISDLDTNLTNLRKEKQEIEDKLKSLNIGVQNTLRDDYDSLVTETNTLEQSLISKNSEIKSTKEKLDNKKNLVELNNQKISDITKQLNDFKDQITKIDNKISEINKQLDFENSKKEGQFQYKSKINQEIAILNQKSHEIDSLISDINSEINDSRLNINTLKSKIIQSEQSLKLLDIKTDLEKINLPIEQIFSKLRSIKRDKNALGNINFNAIDSYEKLAKEYEEIIQKYDIIVAEKAQVEAMLNEINMKKSAIFMDCFDKVNKEFKDIISKMSKSLKGSLELSGQDPLTSNLIINITKNGQTKNIDIISGGEKTITALAVIFAVHAYKKSPFYILDEVDAALDDQNSESLLNYIKELSKSVAVICITHNSTIVSGANQVIGVTLKGNSSVIGLDMAI